MTLMKLVSLEEAALAVSGLRQPRYSCLEAEASSEGSPFTFIQAVLHAANARQLLSDVAMVTEGFYSLRGFS